MQCSELPGNRQFQLWKYSVSHSWLVLRSNKSASFPKRIEILLYGVAAMRLPTVIDDLTIAIEYTSDERTQELFDGLMAAWEPDAHRVFTLRGRHCSAYVLAGGVECHEDDLGFSDPSFFDT